MQNQTVQNGKNMAIVSYIFWLGLFLAIFINNKNKNTFTSFHVRQSFGILLVNLAAGFAYNYIGAFFGSILAFISIFLWVLGVFSAFKGEAKEVPLIGNLFQDLFKGLS